VHPVNGGSIAPGSVASVKVGTLRGSQPNDNEDDAEEPAALFGCVEADAFAVGEEGAVGEAEGPVPALRLPVWACAASIATASHHIVIVARISVRAIARSPVR
jgi:hypothetical protein